MRIMTNRIRIKRIKKPIILGLMLMGLLQPLLAQEYILKDFAEDRNESKYCLYPSTLRMININKNEAYEELASSFEKFLIYQMDSATVGKKSYRDIMQQYRDAGFEEYISVMGGGTTALILGEEKKINEMVGVFGLDDQVFLFFLQGNIQWQKIPTLLNTFAENDLINIFDLNLGKWD